jgi:hypothetical protein
LNFDFCFFPGKKKKLQKDCLSLEELKLNFKRIIEEGPVYVCCSCGCLYFKHSVSKLNDDKILKYGEDFYERVITAELGNLACTTCRVAIYKNKIPTICLKNGLNFPDVPHAVLELEPVEERLICPRLPFLRITSKGRERQKGLIGKLHLCFKFN